MKILLACLLAASASLPQHARVPPKLDDLQQTLAFCGKPLKDTQVPARNMEKGRKMRILTYKEAELHFTSGKDAPGPGWNFSSAQQGEQSIRERAAVIAMLPCFRAVQVAAPETPGPLPGPAPVKSEDTARGASGAMMLLFFAAVMYFIPCLVANSRGVMSPGGIQALNLLLGWTILGWVIALVWAASAETIVQAKAREIDYGKLAAALAAKREEPPH